jgi:hypothetical protein
VDILSSQSIILLIFFCHRASSSCFGNLALTEHSLVDNLPAATWTKNALGQDTIELGVPIGYVGSDDVCVCVCVCVWVCVCGRVC